MKNAILLDFKKLDESGHLKDIILPREDSYAELPFVLDMGSRIYKGRIDRLIIKEGQGDKIAYIYDYKTYPISEEEIPELMERYFFQMDIYKKAVERLFSVKARSYIFFTHEPRLVEMV